MSTIRGNIVSATQARDLYNLTTALLTANGWTQVADTATTPIITGGVEWHVWRNPAANSGLPNDFHVAFGFAASGTGSMFFRVFETWVGLSSDPVADKYEYGCKRVVPTLAGVASGNTASAGPDAYGLDLQPWNASNNATPHPYVATPVFRYHLPYLTTTDPAEFANWNEFSFAVWAQFTASGSFQRQYLDEAGIALMRRAVAENGLPMDFRSKYVSEKVLLVDDETAVEYVVHVSEKFLYLGTARIFNDTWSGMMVSGMEETPGWDPMPLFFHQGLAGSTLALGGSFTRSYKFTNDQPFEWSQLTNNSEFNIEASTASMQNSLFATSLENYTDRAFQPSTTAPTSTNQLATAYKGPVAARVAVMDNMQHLRGLLPESIMVSQISNPLESPQMGFGDETTINGQEYIFVGIGGTNGGVQQVKNQTTNTNYQLRFGFWVRKD